MSITDSPRPELTPDAEPRESLARKLSSRWPILLGAVVVVVVGGILWATHHEDAASTPVPARTVPLTLPDKLSGLAAAPRNADFAAQPAWLSRAKAAAPGATVTGRTYRSAQARRQIRVVAGRADLTGKLEFTWAADAGRTVRSSLGTAHCTQNLKLVARSEAAVRPTVMFCWRTTALLSAYSAIIDLDHHPVDAEGLAALDATWRAALTGH
jgi:hypothetical protein